MLWLFTSLMTTPMPATPAGPFSEPSHKTDKRKKGINYQHNLLAETETRCNRGELATDVWLPELCLLDCMLWKHRGNSTLGSRIDA